MSRREAGKPINAISNDSSPRTIRSDKHGLIHMDLDQLRDEHARIENNSAPN